MDAYKTMVNLQYERLKKDGVQLLESIRDKPTRDAVQDFVEKVFIVIENKRHLLAEMQNGGVLCDGKHKDMVDVFSTICERVSKQLIDTGFGECDGCNNFRCIINK